MAGVVVCSEKVKKLTLSLLHNVLINTVQEFLLLQMFFVI